MTSTSRKRDAALFRLLTRLYPRNFRADYQGELRSFFERDRVRELGRSARPTASLSFWFRTVGDLLRAAFRLRVCAVRQRLGFGNDGYPEPHRGSDLGLHEIVHDVAYAARSLKSCPRFVGAAVLMIALGVGTTTTMFSVINSVLLRPLPYPLADRLIVVGSVFDVNDGGGAGPGMLGPGDFVDLRARDGLFEILVATESRGFDLVGSGEPERIAGAAVTDGFFQLFGGAPHLGRILQTQDHRADAARVVLLGYKLWQGRFAADPDIVGTNLMLSGDNYTVAGVLRDDFIPPEALEGLRTAEIWTVRPLAKESDRARDGMYMSGVGRVRAGVGLAAVQDSVHTLLQDISRESHPEVIFGGAADSLHNRTVGDIGVALRPLLGAAGLFLLISCANLAHLLLTRGSTRQREFALLGALGAPPRRLRRQWMAESLILGLVGGALGGAAAHVAVRSFTVLAPGRVPRMVELGVHGEALAFAFGVAVVACLGSGLVFVPLTPWRRTGMALDRAGAFATSSRRAARTRDVLVAVEIAVALVLVSGAALLTNSFVRLLSVDPGYQTQGVLTMRVRLPGDYRTTAEWRSFFDQLHGAAESIAGVTGVALNSTLPLTLDDLRSWVIAEEPSSETAEPGFVPAHSVSPGYFSAMGIPLLQGRGIGSADIAGAPRVVVVSEPYASMQWPGLTTVVGKRINTGNPADGSPWVTVVGVVAGVRHRLAAEPRAEIYFPFDQDPWRNMNVILTSDGDLTGLALQLRQLVRNVDPALPIQRVVDMEALVHGSARGPRFYTLLASIMAAVALLLALVGVHGSLSYVVSLRVHEIGVRLALGAAERDVQRAVLGRLGRLVLVGLAAGMIGSVLVAGFIERFLFQVDPLDVDTLVASAALLGAAAIGAGWAPARRASRTDPALALRAE